MRASIRPGAGQIYRGAATVAHAGRRSESRLSVPSRTAHLVGPAGRVAHGMCTVLRFWLGSATETASVRAVDRDGEGCADLPHARVGQPSEPLNEDCNRDALDRVHV